MKKICLLGLSICIFACSMPDPASYVRPMMGTSADGCVVPIAAAPFGMVQLGPDTYYSCSGYDYNHQEIIGFSHVHKSGGGCADFQDIMFFPVTNVDWRQCRMLPEKVSSRVSHEQETVEPAYYRVKLLDTDIEAELTATARCGMHRYGYPKSAPQQLIIDLKHGSKNSCTIFPEDNYDTVKVSRLEIMDEYTVRGYRISNGWAPEQHVYFYAEFSKPIISGRLFGDKTFRENVKDLTGTDVRAVLEFAQDGKPVMARVGISPVSMEGARENLKAEITGWDFDAVRAATRQEWNKALSAVQINDDKVQQKEVFYTCLYYALLYPMLYSDVDGQYRSSDSKTYRGDFRYFAGVLGLWDTFRAQNPLITVLRPDVANDLMKTFLEHYRHCGQLPIWTLAGVEDMCMIGYHAMPVIADVYFKGVRDYDVPALYDAMKVSAERDTFGFFLKDYRGARLYNQYGYVPCDLEISSVSKTLEYCYDDWCIAQMAKMLNKKDDYDYYINKAARYKNLFDTDINFMRGKASDGTWRTPFDPFFSNHFRPNDDFCEGTSWQWTFFVPHDGKGLINLMGGKDVFTDKLDSMFIVSPEFRGEHPTELLGKIGQYAHGNEPSHHTLYMYNYAGQPWKAQKLISDVIYTLYNTSPDGICGNDDTGQMSAWYVFSSMGFYPVTHGTGIYFIGTPIFKELTFKHPKGILTIKAPQVSRENCYIQSVRLNGKPYSKNWLRHEDLFGGDVKLEFEMGAQPNQHWGTGTDALPPSMCDETFGQK